MSIVPEPESPLEAISVLEAVSFGYKRTLKILGPLTRISLPLLIISGMGTALYFQQFLVLSQSSDSTGLLMNMGIQMLVGVLACYFYYAIARYIGALYRDDVKPNVMSYLVPDHTLLGVIALGAGYVVTLFGATLASLFPLFLLMFLGIFALVGVTALNPYAGVLVGVVFYVVMYAAVLWMWGFVSVTFATMASMYLAYPEKGLMSAVLESLDLVCQRNLGRTFGLTAGVMLVWFVLMLPFAVLGTMSAFMVENSPSFVNSPMFFIGFSFFYAAHSWAVTAIGFGGFSFTLYRFCFDMKLRAGTLETQDESVVELPASQQTEYARRA